MLHVSRFRSADADVYDTLDRRRVQVADSIDQIDPKRMTLLQTYQSGNGWNSKRRVKRAATYVLCVIYIYECV